VRSGVAKQRFAGLLPTHAASGLPVVRTSVDHGTAFDIVWQGKANPTSLFEAVRLAARLSGPDR